MDADSKSGSGAAGSETTQQSHSTSVSVWEIEVTDEFVAWWRGLDPDQREALTERIDLLGERGPDLGRPLVERIHTHLDTTT
jgi:hypothetical protein